MALLTPKLRIYYRKASIIFFTFDYSTITMLVFLAFINNLMFLDGIFRDLYSDSVIYMSMARRFLEGQPEFLIHPMWPPLYPFISALFYQIFHDWLTAARMVSVVFGSLLVIPFYLIIRDLLGKYPAILASLMLTFLKPVTVASTAPLSEALVMFCFWSGFYLLWICLRGKHLILALLGGIFWGLAYLTRPEGVFALIGFLLFSLSCLVWLNISKLLKKPPSLASFSPKRLALILILAIAGFALTYTPYYAGMKLKYHKSFFSGKASAIFNLNGGATKFNKARDSTWAQDIWSIRTFNPQSEFLYFYGHEDPEANKQLFIDAWSRIGIFYRRFIFTYFGIFGMALAIIGLLKLFLSQRLFFFYSVTISLVMFTAMSFFAPSAQERYIYWILPLFLIAIISGIQFLASAFKKWQTIFILAIFIIFTLVNRENFMFIHLGPPNSDYTPASSAISLIQADNWLTANHPGATVMAGHERVIFNNRGLLIYAPNTKSPKEFLNYARLKKVDFILASRGEIPAALEYLFTKPKNYPGLELEYADNKNSTYIYKMVY